MTGWIAVAKENPASAPEEELRLLAAFSYQASVALRKARLYWQQIEAAEIANALLDASRELATADSPEAVLNRTVEVTARVLGTARASLWIQERDPPDDSCRAWFGGGLDQLRTPIAAEHAQKWLQTTEPFLLEPEQVSQMNGVPAELMTRLLVAPLRLESGRFGALTAMIGERDLGERRLRLLAGLAHQAKLAIETASHYAMLERTFVSTVEALANALEANDAYTSSHARWITDMALLVGREFSLDRAAMKRLEFGALFHDIGKIGIPSEILRKPGPLTDAEFDDREGASRARRADSGADRASGRRAADRPRLSRALGRSRLPGRQGRRRDSDRGADRARLRRVPLDGHRPSVPQPPARRGGHTTLPGGRRDPVRPGGRGRLRTPLRGRDVMLLDCSAARSMLGPWTRSHSFDPLPSHFCAGAATRHVPCGHGLAGTVLGDELVRDGQGVVESREGLVELVTCDRQRRAAHDDVPVRHQIEAALERPLADGAHRPRGRRPSH